jgi:hypothetical protein
MYAASTIGSRRNAAIILPLPLGANNTRIRIASAAAETIYIFFLSADIALPLAYKFVVELLKIIIIRQQL